MVFKREIFGIKSERRFLMIDFTNCRRLNKSYSGANGNKYGHK